jgi:hypothetical protein
VKNYLHPYLHPLNPYTERLSEKGVDNVDKFIKKFYRFFFYDEEKIFYG